MGWLDRLLFSSNEDGSERKGSGGSSRVTGNAARQQMSRKQLANLHQMELKAGRQLKVEIVSGKPMVVERTAFGEKLKPVDGANWGIERGHITY